MSSDDTVHQLQHPDAQERIRALRKLLAHITAEDKDVWQRIEWMALYDQDPLVRQVALAAILTPEGQRYYERWLSTLPWEVYESQKQELEQRAQAGVVDPAAASVILDLFRQYEPPPPTLQLSPEDLPPPPPPDEAVVLEMTEPPEPEEPKPSRTPVPTPTKPPPTPTPMPISTPTPSRPPKTPKDLRLETGGWVRVAVYVGAFLVAAASLLLAGVPEWRLWALFGGTVVFFLLAGVLWYVFRPGAAVFYGLATFYLWADAYVVLQDLWQPQVREARFLFLFAVALLVGVLWGGGAWLFRARIFSSLTAVAFPLGGFWLALAIAPLEPRERWLWTHAFVQAGLLLQWVWTWGLRRWDASLAFPPRMVTSVLATLHALLFPGVVLALFLEGEQLPLHIPAMVTWALLALFFALALLTWPWSWWDGLGLGWSLFWLPIPWALTTSIPFPQLILGGFGLAYALLALPLAHLPERWQRPVFPWALLLSGWILILAGGIPDETSGWTWQAWVLVATGLMIYNLHTVLREHVVLWLLSLLLFMDTYFLFLDFTNIGASLHGALRTLPLVAMVGIWPPVWRYRNKPHWIWATILPEIFLIIAVTFMTLDIPPSSWLPRTAIFSFFALLFFLWALLLHQPFWALGTILYALLAHASMLRPTELWEYWPATYLPYPFLLLALDQLLAPRTDTLAQRWRLTLRTGAWGMMFLLAWPALGVENGSTALTLFLWALVYIHYTLSIAIPWPSLPAALLILLAVAHSLSLRDSPHPAWWISGTLGGLAILLFAIFRRYGQPLLGNLWALLGQLGMYGTAFINWLAHNGQGEDFLFLFGETVTGLLLGLLVRNSVWIWPAIGVMLLSVSVAVIISMGSLGALIVVCGTGLLLIFGGLFFLYRRTRK